MVGADMSARDRQFDPRAVGRSDTIGGKCFDASCPIGPYLVPAAFVPDPQNLDMVLSVNGNVEIDSSTDKMIFSVAEQIAQASDSMTLQPGDIILTGCPAGVGLAKNRFLKVGDVVEGRIGDLGLLRFEIV
jgi:2-keto-4-pentenoate hydratase/2-oxohepta-3-ene-1,7-dioic acid hydratase in catechol pathway